MARQKKASAAILTKAQQRLTGMKSIDPKLNLGNGLTAVSFEKEIVAMQRKIADYHTLLAQADEASNELEMMEKRLSDLTGRVLSGVAAQYGRASSEYEKAGGVRAGEKRRKRSQPELAAV